MMMMMNLGCDKLQINEILRSVLLLVTFMVNVRCCCFIYFLWTCGLNVSYLCNKNYLERQLPPQFEPSHFPGSSLLSVSIEIFSIYFGKLKQAQLRPPRAGVSPTSRFIIITLSTEGREEEESAALQNTLSVI